MTEIKINNNKYKLIENNREGFDKNELENMYTSYFDQYDYILGDWAYGKLRLKGFNNRNNKNFKKINDYNLIHDYIDNNCAYGCKYFIIQKIKD